MHLDFRLGRFRLTITTGPHASTAPAEDGGPCLEAAPEDDKGAPLNEPLPYEECLTLSALFGLEEGDDEG